MKSLWLLVCLLVASSAQAQFAYLDDPALTTSDDADRVMIAADTVSSTQNSIAFTAPRAESGVFTVVISACTACNITPRIETQDPDGTWYAVLIGSALTGNGRTRYAVGARQSSATGTDFTATTLTRLPSKFRMSVVWNSGTSASYTVEGMVW